MADRLADKVAIITGAGRGMGAAGATLFAREGATVVVAERRESAGEETLAAILAAGGKAVALPVDVTDDNSVAELMRTVVERFGKIDILWNNVGGLGWRSDGSHGRSVSVGDGGLDVLNCTLDEWEWFMKLNLTSVFLGCRHVLPYMIQAGKGSIISTSSGAANARSGNFAPYAVGKGGIIVLSRLIAKKYGEHGVRSNVIVPGLTDSWNPEQLVERAKEQVPLKRLGTIDEVASAALFLASDESSYINGDELYLDGGSHI